MTSLTAQTKADSLRIAGDINTILQYRRENPSKAITKTALLINECKRYKDLRYVGKCYMMMGVIHSDIAEYQTAEHYYDSAYAAFDKVKFPLGIGQFYVNTGLMHKRQGNFERAVIALAAGLRIADSIQNEMLLAQLCNNLGITYNDMNQGAKAVPYLLRSLEIYRKKNLTNKIPPTAQNLAVAYDLCNNDKKAEELYLYSIETGAALGDSTVLMYSHDNLGDLYREQKKYKLAYIQHLLAYRISCGLYDKAEQALICNNLSIVALLIGKSDTALLFGEKALNLSKQAFAKKEEVRAYGNLADYYLTKKEYSKGIDMLLRERELMSSLFSAEAAQATSEAMVRYETEKKEKQNQLLQQSNRIKNLELSKTLSENESKNKTIILLMISILLVALLAGFLIYRGKVQRNQQDQNAQFKIQNERIRISRDLHDNVGAQLSIVNSNVDWILSRKKQMTPDELSKRLSELKVLGSEVINTLRESIWAMKNDEISVQEFSDKIKTYLLRLRESSNSVQINFQEKMSNEHIILSPVIALNVFRITQEAINNALKYAGSGSVDVGLDQNGALLRVQILDRGEGFDVEKKKDGHYGLENMKQRALESGIELSIESVIGRGTTVQIIVGKNNASVV